MLVKRLPCAIMTSRLLHRSGQRRQNGLGHRLQGIHVDLPSSVVSDQHRDRAVFLPRWVQQ